MHTVSEPLEEAQVVAVTSDDATGEEIVQEMETKAQCCVDHLCGCK